MLLLKNDASPSVDCVLGKFDKRLKLAGANRTLITLLFFRSHIMGKSKSVLRFISKFGQISPIEWMETSLDYFSYLVAQLAVPLPGRHEVMGSNP